VQHDLRPVLAPDDEVGFRKACFEVAACDLSRFAEQLLACDRLVGIEHRFELLPFDRDRGHCSARLLERVGADCGDRSSLVAALLFELRNVTRADRRMDARECECGREVDARDVRVGIRAAEDRCVQHPGQLEIGCVDRFASRSFEAVDARRGLPDDLPRAGGPLLQRVLFDDEPDLLEPAFDFLLGADQSCHVRIASSILGYAPQRQRLPAIAWRISSVEGAAFASTSATALTI